MLSDALHLDQLGDYEALHKGFETFLRLSRWDWDSRDGASFSDELEQFYRVALIGLSGRVIILAESKKIEEPSGLLAVARVICGGVARLAADVAQAFSYQDQSQATLWSEWEWEGAEPGIARTLSSERYPLTFFAVRLMELSSDDMPLIDLHGTASQALSWFELNADRLLPFVSDQPGATREQRRDLAIAVLKAAVRIDEISEDDRVIASELSPEKVADFKSGVYAIAFGADPVERLFARHEAFLYLATDTDSIPEERCFFEFASKGFLADMQSGGRISYAPLEGHPLGQRVANDVMRLFCKALDEAPLMTAQLDTPEDLLSAFERAKSEIDESSDVVAVLAGDWFDIETKVSRT